ncbi:MAG: Lrp/AsnC ligand binding domain-containing protein [Candidatus Odinarchaeota archaeon]
MTRAFILIETKGGSKTLAVEELRGIPGVIEACTVHGYYDIICRVEATSTDALKETVVEQIRALNSVRFLITLTVKKESLP